MQTAYYAGNRARLYEQLAPGDLIAVFSGDEVWKTADKLYPFFADRNFLYLTGLTCRDAVLLAAKDADGSVQERLYLLPPDLLAERWTGRRVKPAEASAVSGVADIRVTPDFAADFRALAASGNYGRLFLDLYRFRPELPDRPAHRLLRAVQRDHAWLQPGNACDLLRRLRLYKQPCEIAALRRAEEITAEGIRAMMRHSRPGKFEYQYKADFDYALAQHGPDGPGFPPIISAGQNNFCIHYYSYTGQAQAGDMVLADVGAQHDHLTVDVSRAFPCGGKFSDRQRRIHDCLLATSDYLFSIIRPGMKMADVDATIRRYNAQRLADAGVIARPEDVGEVMWHGGAHHIGYDVHDMVRRPETIAPDMVFCVDIGVYKEDWGIGFRLEDNCLVTETGCENLSAAIPRTADDIERAMRGD